MGRALSVIPVGDVIPTRTRPAATVTIAAITLLSALVVRVFSQRHDAAAAFGLIPAQFSIVDALTALAIHVSWLALAINLVALWLFGRTLEDRLGHARFVLLYLLGGLAGAVAATAADPGSLEPVFGAGGAVGAIAGGYVALFPRSRMLMLTWLPFAVDAFELPAVVLLALWCFGQLVAAAETASAMAIGGVGQLWSALGGLIMGAGVVRLLARPERQRVEWWS